jgi:hypothetical protein
LLPPNDIVTTDIFPLLNRFEAFSQNSDEEGYLRLTREDFQRLAQLRETPVRPQEVETNKVPYYLAGHAVECALKACIAKRQNATNPG